MKKTSTTSKASLLNALRRLLCAVILLGLTFTGAKAQVVNMTNGSTTTCSSDFYDSGGSGGSYVENENFTYTFMPASSGAIKLVWNYFNSEMGMIIYTYIMGLVRVLHYCFQGLDI